MTKPTQPAIWVRVVEAHAARTWAVIILAAAIAVSMISLTIGGTVLVLMDPGVTDLPGNFAAAINSTVGVAVGGVIGYIGGAQASKMVGPPKDDEMTLEVKTE